MTHAPHAMKSPSARSNTRAMTGTLASKTEAFAVANGALAVDAGAFAMDAAALAMDGLSILRVQRGLAGPVRVAHDPAEVEPVIVRNFAPALPGLMHCYDIVEALAGFISQQMRSLQLAVS